MFINNIWKVGKRTTAINFKFGKKPKSKRGYK